MSNENQIYVTAVKSTGAKPDFFVSDGRSPDSLSMELIVYHRLVHETNTINNHIYYVKDIINSTFFHRIDVPKSRFTENKNSNFLVDKLTSLINPKLPFTIEKARWSPDSNFTSHKPVGNLAARLLKIGSRIIDVQPHRPLVRMTVLIAKVTIVKSLVFGQYMVSMWHRYREDISMVAAVVKAATATNSALPVKYNGGWPHVWRSEVPELITCPICLDDMIGSIYCIPCNHKFHDYCLLKWEQRNNTCPICRSPLSKP